MAAQRRPPCGGASRLLVLLLMAAVLCLAALAPQAADAARAADNHTALFIYESLIWTNQPVPLEVQVCASPSACRACCIMQAGCTAAAAIALPAC